MDPADKDRPCKRRAPVTSVLGLLRPFGGKVAQAATRAY
jgi:hypothetical protein